MNAATRMGYIRLSANELHFLSFKQDITISTLISEQGWIANQANAQDPPYSQVNASGSQVTISKMQH